MTKSMRKKSIIFFILLIGLIGVYCFWDYARFSSAVQKDARRLFASHKEFFRSVEFSGIITEKEYCNKCQFNRYRLIVELKVKKPGKIELGDLSYPPYYFFNDNNQLVVSVTQQIYNSSEKGHLIGKVMNYDSLIYEGSGYRLLSDYKSEWLPEIK